MSGNKSPNKRVRTASKTRALSPVQGAYQPSDERFMRPANFTKDEFQLALVERTAVPPLPADMAGPGFMKLGALKQEIKTLTETVHLGIAGKVAFHELEIRVSTHILIHGPTGLGKSALGRGLRTFASTYPGYRLAYYSCAKEDQDYLSTLFHSARMLQPSIIFVDRVDRRFQTNAACLANELESMELTDLVFVVGTATVWSDVDASLRTCWTFSKVLELTVPTQEGRREIIFLRTHWWSGMTDQIATSLVDRTANWTSAAIVALLKTGAQMAIKRTNPQLLLGSTDPSLVKSLHVTLQDFA